MQANNIVKFNRIPVAANNIVSFRSTAICPELDPAIFAVDEDFNPLTCAEYVEESPETLSMTIGADPELSQMIVEYINENYPDAIAFNESTEYIGGVRVECLTPDTFWSIVSTIIAQ